jgi:hypothetical protein
MTSAVAGFLGVDKSPAIKERPTNEHCFCHSDSLRVREIAYVSWLPYRFLGGRLVIAALV